MGNCPKMSDCSVIAIISEPTSVPKKKRVLNPASARNLSRCAGVVATACTQGKRTQHGKPRGVIRDEQPDAREGRSGRPGVTERLVVPLKSGNAGGGKGPQFKTGA